MSTVRKSTRRPLACAALVAVLTSTAGADRLGEATSGSELCRLGKLAAMGAGLDEAFDDATGRDLRNYPPDRVVDYIHMKLQMRFEDLNDRRFSATEFLSFIPVGRPATALSLDAIGLRIDAVRLDERPVEHFHDGETLSVVFPAPLPVGSEHMLTIEYVCDDPWDGMFFTPSRPEAPHYTAEVHTQGQADTDSRSPATEGSSPSWKAATAPTGTGCRTSRT
jgi:hypothetical protein